MSRNVLANSITLENGKAVEEVVPELLEKWKQWEIPVLVLLSLTLQVILVLWSNRRRNTNSLLLNAVIWSCYNAADPVAILALGVISSNLTEFIRLAGSSAPLEPRSELVTFWAPFLLLHLGGPDTITAFQMEDNELWQRHLLTLVVQTGLTLYILFRAWTMSTLSALSVLMFTAGSIKYAERTWSLWTSSYEKRRQNADKAFTEFKYDTVSNLKPESEIARVVIATKMFRETQGMFADAYVLRKQLSKSIVKQWSSPEVMKIVEMELQMMYDKLYTKARVIFSYTGIALRFISFLLVSIALILFSSSERRKRRFHNIPEYSLTFGLFAVSIGLELYAAFLFVTSYWTISWFWEKRMVGIARSMKKLASLRTRDWSNRMGQFSEIRYLMHCQPKQPQIMSRIILRRRRISLHVYHRPVPEDLTHFIHEHLKRASTSNMYSNELTLLQSRGRVPWKRHKWDQDSNLEHFPYLYAEFGEMIIFFHLVTEVCYYIDRQVFEDNVADDHRYRDIFRKARVSKYLSRYLMHLFVVSSDLLPQRTPLSKNKFFKEFNTSWETFLTSFKPGDGDGEGEERRGKATYDNKANARARKADGCKMLLERPEYIGSYYEAAFALKLAKLLLRSMRLGDNGILQLESRWELLGAMWVELLVYAADQCKGKAHAQHLRKGGELLTHVWVLLGHFDFIDEAILPIDDLIERERFLSQFHLWEN